MKVEDPGHLYRLAVLDAETESYDWLAFVKRKGDNYPGNINAYPGTTSQEVMRALIERAKYVDSQIPHVANTFVMDRLRECIYMFEARAAERHGRVLQLTNFERINIEILPTCPKCGHIKPEFHEECGIHVYTWEFNRFVHGKPRAQGAKVRASTFEEALLKAQILFENSLGTTFENRNTCSKGDSK